MGIRRCTGIVERVRVMVVTVVGRDRARGIKDLISTNNVVISLTLDITSYTVSVTTLGFINLPRASTPYARTHYGDYDGQIEALRRPLESNSSGLCRQK